MEEGNQTSGVFAVLSLIFLLNIVVDNSADRVFPQHLFMNVLLLLLSHWFDKFRILMGFAMGIENFLVALYLPAECLIQLVFETQIFLFIFFVTAFKVPQQDCRKQRKHDDIAEDHDEKEVHGADKIEG